MSNRAPYSSSYLSSRKDVDSTTTSNDTTTSSTRTSTLGDRTSVAKKDEKEGESCSCNNIEFTFGYSQPARNVF